MAGFEHVREMRWTPPRIQQMTVVLEIRTTEYVTSSKLMYGTTERGFKRVCAAMCT